jgi:hypothetical protein
MVRVQLFMRTKDRQGVNHMLVFERSETKDKILQDLNEMPADALVPIKLIGDQGADVTVRWGEVSWWLVNEVQDDSPTIKDEDTKKPNIRPLGGKEAVGG